MSAYKKMGFWVNDAGTEAGRTEVHKRTITIIGPAREAVLKYMMAARRGPSYMGYGQCRLCNHPKWGSPTNLGDADMYTPDGKWMFPEGWEHYITVHGLGPTDWGFINDAIAWAINPQEDSTRILSTFWHKS